MPNIDHLLEVITRSINELGRAKEQLLREKQREETAQQPQLMSREDWERLYAPDAELQDDRGRATHVMPDVVRQRTLTVETPTETKTPAKNTK